MTAFRLGALLLAALLLATPASSAGCEISSESELLAISGTEVCVLTADITLSEPLTPIQFQGEIDGQGHWIKGIDFDFQKIYDDAPANGDSKTIAVHVFSAPKALRNIGLEFNVDFKNNVGYVLSLSLGAVGDQSSLEVRDVVINGTLQVASGEQVLNGAYVGSIVGNRMAMGSIIKSNVTSYCSVGCDAKMYCHIGGLAGYWNGNITGAAFIGGSLSAVASNIVSVGGIAGILWYGDVDQSFSEPGSISVKAGKGSVGGFAGQFSGETILDSYSLVSSMEVEFTATSQPERRVSSFIGFVSSPDIVTIARCYTWLTDVLEVISTGSTVHVGGLVGTATLQQLSLSSSFASIQSVRSLGKADAFAIGGLCGQISSSLGDPQGEAVRIDESWSSIAIQSVPAGTSSHLGGLCGIIKISAGSVILQNLAVGLELDTTTLGTSSTRLAGVFVGEMSGSVSGVVVEYTCSAGGCSAVPFVSKGSAAVSNAYVAQSGGEVSKGSETGGFVVVTDKYDSSSYSGLSGWDFYDDAYPTLSSLPVADRTGRNTFAKPAALSWSAKTWMVPDAESNNPQLVENKMCKEVGGDALCVSCPDGVCVECENGAELQLNGAVCSPCPPGFESDSALKACVTTDCSSGCELCGTNHRCLSCGGDDSYLDVVSENPTKECIGRQACLDLGAIADASESGRAVCRARRELCEVGDAADGASPAVPSCVRCPEVNEGDTLVCEKCAEDYYINLLPGETLFACLSQVQCKIGGGMLAAAGDEQGAPKTCVPMSCSDQNCDSCFEGATKCTECKEGFLHDLRLRAAPGACIAEADCARTAKPADDGKSCVSLACAVVEHCNLCGQGEEEATCLDCDSGYDLILQEPEVGGDENEGSGEGAGDAEGEGDGAGEGAGEGTGEVMGVQFCQKQKASLSEGAIAGIVFVVILCVIIGGALAVYFCCRKKKAERAAAV